MAAADGMVLAETAPQGTAGKKYSSAAFGITRNAADTGFFPVMQGRSGRYYLIRTSAVAGTDAPVCPAHSGT